VVVIGGGVIGYSVAVIPRIRPRHRHTDCVLEVGLGFAVDLSRPTQFIGRQAVEAGEPLDQAYLDGATWEVEIAGRTHPAVASFRPLHDPTMSRVKG
jgi:hypothetical protein